LDEVLVMAKEEGCLSPKRKARDGDAGSHTTQGDSGSSHHQRGGAAPLGESGALAQAAAVPDMEDGEIVGEASFGMGHQMTNEGGNQQQQGEPRLKKAKAGDEHGGSGTGPTEQQPQSDFAFTQPTDPRIHAGVVRAKTPATGEAGQGREAPARLVQQGSPPTGESRWSFFSHAPTIPRLSPVRRPAPDDERETLRGECQQLRAKVKTLQVSLGRARQEDITKDKQITQLRNHLEQARQENITLREEQDKKKEELTRAQEALRRSESELRAKRREVEEQHLRLMRMDFVRTCPIDRLRSDRDARPQQRYTPEGRTRR
jgi:hypothetical protein